MSGSRLSIGKAGVSSKEQGKKKVKKYTADQIFLTKFKKIIGT